MVLSLSPYQLLPTIATQYPSDHGSNPNWIYSFLVQRAIEFHLPSVVGHFGLTLHLPLNPLLVESQPRSMATDPAFLPAVRLGLSRPASSCPHSLSLSSEPPSSPSSDPSRSAPRLAGHPADTRGTLVRYPACNMP